MPRIVDHDLRRREVARAAVRVIARGGLAAATTRQVAEESGWSTGVLRHYFTNRDEVLAYALRELEAVNVATFAAAAREPTGLEAVRAAVASTGQHDPDHAKVWIAFLARAATDPAAATEMRRGARAWRRRWAALVRRGQSDRSIRPELDADAVGADLYALVAGLRMATAFGPPGVAAARRRAEPVTLLEAIQAPEGALR